MKKIILLLLLIIIVTKLTSAATIFSDDFESGSLSGWTLSNVAGANNWTASTTNPFQGTWHANSNPRSTTEPASVFERTISTLGYTSIIFNYTRRLIGIDTADEFQAEWFNGTTWTIAEQTGSSSANDASYISKQFSLPATANNNQNFKIKFECTAGATTEFCRIDDILISGTPDTTSPAVFLLNPTNNTEITINTTSFTARFIDNLNVTNTTLYIWNSTTLIGTNFTILGNSSISANLSFTLPRGGTYFWNFQAFDTLANNAFNNTNLTLLFTFTSDLTSSNISITFPQNTSYNINITQLNYTISSDASSCWYSTNNGLTNTSINCGNNASNLISNQGSNTWTIYANDSANNLNSSTVTFFVDSITPLISYTSPTPANNSILAQNSIFINTTITETNFANITFSLSNATSLINQTTFTSQTLSINFTSLPDGTYFYNVTIKDILNNQNTTETRTITLDKKPSSVFNLIPIQNSNFNLSNIIEISANVTETSSINAVIADIIFPNNTILSLLLTNSQGNKYNDSFTIPSNLIGRYNVTFIANDSLNNINSTEKTFFNVDDVTPPQFSALTENPSNGTTYSANQKYEFNITWTDNIKLETVLIEFNGINYTASNSTLSIYNVTLSNLASGTYNYYWYTNDSTGNSNTTQMQSYAIAKAQGNITLLLNNTVNNITLLYPSQINASAISPTNQAIQLLRNNINITSQNHLFQNLAVDYYNFTAVALENQNYTSTIITLFANLTKGILSGSISLSPASSVTYPTQTTITGAENNQGDGDITYTLTRNLIQTSNPEILTLGAGTYNYTYNSTQGQNWTSSILDSKILIINQGSSDVRTFLNNSRSNITIEVNSTIHVNSTLFAGQFGSLNLTQNNIQLNFSTNSNLTYLQTFNSLGNFLINTSYSGNTNYSSDSEAWFVTVIDSTPPSITQLTESPSDPATYSQNAIYQFNATIIDNLALRIVLIEFNGINYTIINSTSNTYNFTIQNLAAGTYSYYWRANDSLGNINITPTQTYTVNKTASNISLYINHTKSNTTIYQDTQIYLNSTRTIGEGIIKLYNNNSLINQGQSPLSNLTNFIILGIYNITTIHEETQNYTSSSETFYVNVIQIPDTTFPLISIIQPQNTSYNTAPLQLNYSVSDTNLNSCWYSTNSGIINTSVTCGNNISIISSQGSNTWTIYANDSANNLNSSTVTFFVDSIIPLISYTSPTPANNSILAQNSIFINTTITETNFANITFFLSNTTSLINQTIFTTQTLSINFTSLPDGTYFYNVTIKDILNNQNTTETRTITIDSSTPSIQIINPTNNTTYKNSSILINISSNGQTTWFYNGTANETYISPIYKSFPEGTNTIIGYANNSAGTTTSASLIFFINTLVLTCEVGGPYQQEALILVQGTLRNETTLLNSKEINISIYKNNQINISKTAATSSDGSYETSFENFSVGAYSLNTSVSHNGLNESCSDNFQIGSSASLILDKIANIYNISNEQIYYNIILKLTNKGGSNAINTNITDSNSQNSPYYISTISSNTNKQLSYLINLTRQSSTSYHLTSIATVQALDSYTNSLITTNSTSINLTIPPTIIGKQIIILKNILYISETNLNVTYNITSTLFNSGDEDLIDINYIDTDINSTATLLNLTKGNSKQFTNTLIIIKAASNTQHEFALGTATISSLNFYSNRPKINIPGYGGPADIIVYAPSSLNPLISFDSIIEIKNVNPDIGQDFPITHWITNNDETQNFSSGQKTIYVGANSLVNTTVTLTSPSTAGTYKLKAIVVWVVGTASAFDAFEVITSQPSIPSAPQPDAGEESRTAISPKKPEKGKQPEETEKKEIICNSPYIKHGKECCLDTNNNLICDEDEKSIEQPQQAQSIPITGFIIQNITNIRIIINLTILLINILIVILSIILIINIIRKKKKKQINRLSSLKGKKVFTSEGIEIGEIKEIFIENHRIHSLQIKLKKKKKFKPKGIYVNYKYIDAIKDIIIINHKLIEKLENSQKEAK